MKRAKILHVCPVLSIGGTEKVAYLFCKGLNQLDDYDVFLLHRTDRDQTRLPSFQEILGQDHVLGYKNEIEARKIIFNLNPDIIHTHRSGGPEFPEAGVDYVRSIKTVETNIFGAINHNPHIDKTLFVSKWLFDHVISLEYRNYPRFDYVYNPVEEPCSQENLKDEFNIHSNTLVIGRVGRPDNGIYDNISIKALECLMHDNLFTTNFVFLVLAPPPNMVDDLKKFNIPFKIVEPTVDEHRISSYYNTIDVMAHARADGETCGCNIQEAMIHSVPVVTHWTKSPHHFNSQTEIVHHCKTGFVSKYNVDNYSQYLKTLLSDESLRSEMSAQSQQIASKHFSLEKITSKLNNIYKELLNGSFS